MHELRKRLKSDNALNPFNKKFSKEAVDKIFEEFDHATDETTISLLETCSAGTYLNGYYNFLYRSMYNSFIASGLNYKKLCKYQISIINRNYLLIRQDRIAAIKQSAQIHFSDGLRQKIESLDPSIGKIDAISAAESEVDSLNMIINYLFFFENTLSNDTQKSHNDSIIALRLIHLLGSSYHVLKSEYDECIWNDGTIELHETESRLTIKCDDHKEILLRKVGTYRLLNTINNFSLQAIKETQDDAFTKVIIDSILSIKKKKRIKTVTVSDGILSYTLAKGESKEEYASELMAKSAILSFYPFLQKAQLPLKKSLTIDDCISMFTNVQHLIDKAADVAIKNPEVKSSNDFSKFVHEIKYTTLKNYLIERTNYTREQIIDFLSLIIHEKGRLNFWETPFLKIEDTLLFPLLSLKDPLLLHQVDCWLQKGGIDLDSRGTAFEKYIKKELSMHLADKEYEYKIPNQSEYKTKNDKEEIDLIICLKSIVIVAEIKCIRYPMEPRDYSYMKEKLTKASKQVMKKSKFLERNHRQFENILGNYQNKKIIPLIITNYTFFTGVQINDIPIVDFIILESYFSSGELSRVRVESNKGKIISKTNHDIIHLYNNENDFSLNFEKYMKNPPGLKFPLSLLEIKDSKITIGENGLQIYTTVASYK